MQKRGIGLDYNYMMAEKIGPNGITERDFSDYESEIRAAARRAHANPENDGFRRLPSQSETVIQRVEETADWIIGRHEAYVLLGIGASALGPQMIQGALNHLHYNELNREKRKYPRIYIEDNIDPERMASLLEIVDLKDTVFNIISKTGTTTETTAQTMIVLDALRKAGLEPKEHLVMVTDEQEGSFSQLAKEEGCRLLPIPREIQGRFCNLTPICLLPAAVGGLDIRSLMAGAENMEQRCKAEDYQDNIALLDAALQYIAYRKGADRTVMMPYADALRYVPDFFTILWDESLCGAGFGGQNPIKAMGVTDQHSQMPQYIMSPKKKLVTTLYVERYRKQVPIPDALPQNQDADYLKGHTLEELIQAEHFGNCYALGQAGCMNKTILLPEINEFTMGELLEFFMLETVYMGELLGVDPYNIPKYDDTKAMTSAQFQRKGYEWMRKKLEELGEPDARFIR